jgi:hypothetical protein
MTTAAAKTVLRPTWATRSDPNAIAYTNRYGENWFALLTAEEIFVSGEDIGWKTVRLISEQMGGTGPTVFTFSPDEIQWLRELLRTWAVRKFR